MAAILRDILDAEGSNMTDDQRKLAAAFLGREDVATVTNRELMLLRQVQKAIKSGSTSAFVALAKMAGEMVEEVRTQDGAEVFVIYPKGVCVDKNAFANDPEAMAALQAEEEAQAGS